jgi:hypothetical protein
MQQQGNLIKKGRFYFIYDGDLNLVLEDKTKRGLEVLEFVFDEKLGVQADRGTIYDLNGKGHKVGIRWYFPKSKYGLDHVIKIGEEMELRYKAIREMTCPEDE